jgi:hypothetical protein
MEGMIRVAFTRDPDVRQAAAVEGERGATLVFHDGEGRFLGFCSRSVRRRYLDGEPVRVGYLGQLRAVEGTVGLRRLRQGYERLRALRQPDEAPFDLTAILADNLPARRLLERGLPGLPPYRPLTRLETLIVPTARRRYRGALAEPAAPEELPEILAFLEAQLRRRPFAPVWAAEDFTPGGRARGLAGSDFFLLREAGEIVAVGALWDQRAFKQTVIQGYGPWLRALRPMVNAGLWAVGQPRLPPPGSVLPLAYLACFAAAGEDEEGLERASGVVEAARRGARRRGLGQVAFTLPQEHPWTVPLRRRFAARPYRSVLYGVLWEGEAPSLPPQSWPYLEAALL